MGELAPILTAFDLLCREGQPSALVTVIATSGSAYRRAGARMLIALDGRSWGAVSGGCLDRDVALRARGVIETGRPVICRYNTSDEEELASGAATGCGGMIDLFLQPLSSQMPGPMETIRRVLRERQPLKVLTLLRASGVLASRAGECAVFGEGNLQELFNFAMVRSAWPQVAARLMVLPLPWSGDGGAAGLPADVLLELIIPPQPLVIFGGGPDVVPVLTIAKTLGWHVSVVTARPATDASMRFSQADLLHINSSDDPLAGVQLPEDCAVVLMTHNFLRDLRILSSLPPELAYLGILGPRERTDRLLSESPAVAAARDIFSPIGLDMAAETPQEIALSIIAEIQAVLRKSTAKSLRDRPGPIHLLQAESPPAAPNPPERNWSSSCLV